MQELKDKIILDLKGKEKVEKSGYKVFNLVDFESE